MDHRIDTRQLSEFVLAQAAHVESVPITGLLADIGERATRERLSRQELEALWLAAGLATHVGLAIYEQPERFITTKRPRFAAA